jgi:hypothetical protein
MRHAHSDLRTCRVFNESVVQECEEHEGPRRVPAVAHPAPRPPPNLRKIPGKIYFKTSINQFFTLR